MKKRGGVWACWLVVLAVAASLVLSGYRAATLPRGCTIDGEDVSGMTVAQARAHILRALQEDVKDSSLTIEARGREYVFRPPMLAVRTNLDAVLAKAQGEAGEYVLEKELVLLKMEDTLRGICDECYQKSRAASAIFTPNGGMPFRYEREIAGRYADGRQLKEDVLRALESGGGRVSVRVYTVRPRVTLERVREQTKRLSTFSTRYADGGSRAHNIALAAQKIDGTVLEAGETFSFNETVGARTKKNGFENAPIIQDGAFTPGIGGGVCQVSTTVYNAALLAGMQVSEYHPHSLAVGYVEPSFDAMVNGSECDLKFINRTGGKIYLTAKAKSGTLTIAVYGVSEGVSYERKSVVLERVAPPEPQVREGDTDCEIRAEKEGLRSEGYLIRRTAKGEEVLCLRRDRYAPVQGIVQKSSQNLSEGKAFQYLAFDC